MALGGFTKDESAPSGYRKGPKYPNVKVKLTGQDGNAFNLLAIMQREMRRAGIEQSEVEAFFEEATDGDYDHLLATCMKWVDVR